MKKDRFLITIAWSIIYICVAACSDDNSIDSITKEELTFDNVIKDVCISWGSSISNVKTKMKGYKCEEEDAEYLNYSHNSERTNISYSFVGGKLSASAIIIESPSDIKATDYIKDYVELGILNSKHVYYDEQNNTMCFTYNQTEGSIGYLVIGFAPITSELYKELFDTVTDLVVSESHAVDLGLSVKWADMNVGAKSPTGNGDYFAWGETSSKTNYTEETYKWFNGNKKSIKKYCINNNYGYMDNKITLELEDDAAAVNWGGKWRMPTYEEIQELIDKCTWSWSKQSDGTYGWKVKGPSGQSIFLPLKTGYRINNTITWMNEGHYFSSSITTYSQFKDESVCAKILDLHDNTYNYKYSISKMSRFCGGVIRAVYPK